MSFLVFTQFVIAQSIEISGVIKNKTNSENIHIINKTAKLFTITDKKGQFTIIAKLNDTLSFSSIQHKDKAIIVSKAIIESKIITVVLEEQIEALDEVIVGKVLTGDLLSDIGNLEGDLPINFYDLGIPGYTGKIATQNERRLSEAGAGQLKWYAPLTGVIPLNPIINGITGRTKMLKEHVQHEKNETLLHKIKTNLSESLFVIDSLDVKYRTEFFYFCEADKSFYSKCSGKKDLEVLAFLKEKLKQYKANLKAFPKE